MYRLLIGLFLLILPSPVFASGGHHDDRQMYIPERPVMRYENRRTDEYWWWRDESPQVYVPERLVPFCRRRQGPPIYDYYGNIIACGPAPY
jgi:hypothetical protein